MTDREKLLIIIHLCYIIVIYCC